ncbi:MAG: hypothetical protein COB85_08800, partial [Bacteroidetes bacterium]
MKTELSYQVNDIDAYKSKLMNWASKFDSCCILQSNRTGQDINSKNPSEKSYDLLVASGGLRCFEGNDSDSFESLKSFCSSANSWVFGFFTYDLKNELEDLKSENYDGVGMPSCHFFNPEYLFMINGNEVTLQLAEGDSEGAKKLKGEIERIDNTPEEINEIQSISQRITKEAYLKSVKEIKEHISYGNIYELNFCQEFYAEDFKINPFQLFEKLNSISETPFACFYRLDEKYLICGSPERFIRKKGSQIISQPIKGTIKRGNTEAEDLALAQNLAQSEKDKNENDDYSFWYRDLSVLKESDQLQKYTNKVVKLGQPAILKIELKKSS